MAKKESLQKKIDKLDRLAKFYQSLLLAVLLAIKIKFSSEEDKIIVYYVYFIIWVVIILYPLKKN